MIARFSIASMILPSRPHALTLTPSRSRSHTLTPSPSRPHAHALTPSPSPQVAGVLLLVIGTVVGMGWELGFLEGICFAILIGLSCDFVLHMAHAYQHSAELTREGKSRDALSRMGPPVFAAALTTAATGAVMYGCTILFFLRFGTILLLTMVYAVLTAVFFFLALTNVAGPQGRFCSLASLCAAVGKKPPAQGAPATEEPAKTKQGGEASAC